MHKPFVPFRPFTISILLASFLLLNACNRDIAHPDQKTTTSQSEGLTGLTIPLIAGAGTLPGYPVQTVLVKTLSGINPSMGTLSPFALGGSATDAAGNLYFSGLFSSVIYKYNAGTNTLSIFAGDGHAGFKNGPLLSAEFSFPSGLAFDAQGNLYVADEFNNRIRIITPGGTVSTYAGSGVQGVSDGADSIAKFNQPTGVAVDGNGTVYVADNGNNRIRRIASSTKVVTQWCGSGTAGFADGPGTLAAFNGPYAIAVTAAGVA